MTGVHQKSLFLTCIKCYPFLVKVWKANHESKSTLHSQNKEHEYSSFPSTNSQFKNLPSQNPNSKKKTSKALLFFLSLPHAPFSRATPYPEVTVLFCRLPLLTLCPKLEAFHLWNLLRIFVRLGWKIILSLWFSRWIERDGKLMFKSNFNFRGLPVDLTTIVINNTLGVFFSSILKPKFKNKKRFFFFKN